MMVKSTISVEPDTRDRFNGDKGLYQASKKRTVEADEFLNHLLDLYEQGT